jgi:hypothetical protein
MAYDAESDRVVLFGSLDGANGCSNETWCYDFNANSWTNMTPATSPPAMTSCQMAYDSESDLIILFGDPGNTWTYDLNSNIWTEMLPATSPPVLWGHAMTYDSKGDRVILFDTNTTWTYDVDANIWEQKNPAVSVGTRYAARMVYDENSECTILYGGVRGLAEFTSTWAYSLASDNWTWMADGPNSPGMPDGFAMSYDSYAEKVLLFGALGPTTWTYGCETNTWSEMSPVSSPHQRSSPCMAYDSESHRSILFGGTLVYSGDPVADTWAYSADDNAWCCMDSSADDGTFCFVAYGDTRGEFPEVVAPVHSDLVSLYAQHDPEFVIHTGDMVLSGACAVDWLVFNDTIYLLRNLGIPLYGVPGNHEVYGEGDIPPDEDLSNYQAFFDYSDVVDQPGETELYYSFDAHGIHFVFLNTATEWGPEGFMCSPAQMAWLESDLAGHDFIIVTFHVLAWSVRANRPDRWAEAESIRNTFHALFQQYGVDLVFNGHDHYYYRTIRDGIYYVATGGGGAPLAEIQTEGTVWQSGDVGFSDYHYCVAKVNEGRLTIEVFLMNGMIADSFAFDLSEATAPASPFPWAVVAVAAAAVMIAVVVVVLVIRREHR